MATDTSEIYKKKHHTKKTKQNNITGFGIAIVVSLAIAFLWTILGTNFTYITHLAVSKLNILSIPITFIFIKRTKIYLKSVSYNL